MWTTATTRSEIACVVRAVDRFWEKPWIGAGQKCGVVGHTIPAPHERVGDLVV